LGTKYAGLGLNELRHLRGENAKQKRLVADPSLDHHILQEASDPSERAGRQPCTLRLPTADCVAQARGPGDQRQAHLPAVYRGGVDRANEETERKSATAAHGGKEIKLRID